MKFFIISLNGTASAVGLLAFVAFVIFSLNGNQFYKPAFYVLIISIIIGFITPNIKETSLYFNDKNQIDIK